MTFGDWLYKDFIDKTCRMNCSKEVTCHGDILLSLPLVAGIEITLNS